MIAIDFQGGAHGNYLEFVCNTLLGITQGMPFDLSGAAHAKTYIGAKHFVADHWSFWPKPITCSKVVSIQISTDDLLPLQQISLLRAGNYGIDNNSLEINTYHKLNNRDYRWVLDSLVQNFFSNQIKVSYNAVKDPSWPEVDTLQDYQNLPKWIQQECEKVHNLELLILTADSPHCPRPVLREFFQLGFANPEQHGFIQRQQLIQYPESCDVLYFPFGVFYNLENFLAQIAQVADWAGINFSCQDQISNLHQQFLYRQPYSNSRILCNTVIDMIQAGHTKLPTLDLLQEAYVNAKLKQEYFQ